jgi:hypothetical protein
MTPLRAAPADRAAGELPFGSEVQDDAGAFDRDSLQAKAGKVRKETL